MAPIKHTIISWDSSFRNFFHLIDGLLAQEYPRTDFELIFVEQRSQTHADAYNHSLGLKTLHDRCLDLGDALQLRAEYLNEPPHAPYHLGRCVNRGLALARGEIISVMDGDLLLPKDFLSKLEEQHQKGPQVVNLLRLMAASPVNADFERWVDGAVDFDLCLQACPPVPDPFPANVNNKGPMISARRGDWKTVGGYDEHPIWSTGLSRLGQDVNSRLELASGAKSVALPDRFAVHPYHPAGFSRSTLDSVRLLSLQANLIDWAREQGEVSWKKRTQVADRMFKRNLALIERIHGVRPSRHSSKLVRRLGSSELLGKGYSRARTVIENLPAQWRLLANV